MNAAVIGRVAFAVESTLESGIGLAADGGGHEDATAPNDGARMREAWNLCFPDDVLRLTGVPGDWRIGAVGDARGLRAAEGGPVLGGSGRGREHQGREESAVHFATILVNSLVLPPLSSVKPVTLSSSTLK